MTPHKYMLFHIFHLQTYIDKTAPDGNFFGLLKNARQHVKVDKR